MHILLENFKNYIPLKNVNKKFSKVLENFKNYIPLKNVNKKFSKVNTKSKSDGFFQKVMKLPPQSSKDASSPRGAKVPFLIKFTDEEHPMAGPAKKPRWVGPHPSASRPPSPEEKASRWVGLHPPSSTVHRRSFAPSACRCFPRGEGLDRPAGVSIREDGVLGGG